ncbi:MAG: glycosyltransferase [Thermodesulfobacteriota bacterium]
MSTFVSVGNAKQPFRRLLDAIAHLAPSLPQPVIVQHGHTPFASTACQITAFMGMEEFAHHVKTAELLILHAGAGSVIHAIEADKCPVVMPRRANLGEHVNDHQIEFARTLAEAGKVVVADGPEHLGGAITAVLGQGKQPGATMTADRSELRMVNLVSETLADYACHL